MRISPPNFRPDAQVDTRFQGRKMSFLFHTAHPNSFSRNEIQFQTKMSKSVPHTVLYLYGFDQKSIEQTEFLTKENLHSHGYVHFPLKNNNVCSDEGLMLETSATHQTRKTKWRP